MRELRYIDLFCGIGGFRIAVEQAANELNLRTAGVFSSDIDTYAKLAYKANFKEEPHGDITLIKEFDVPDHDILIAGFPCQPFSIIGEGKGFDDTRGTLFFDIARILKEKKPSGFVLENVKRLVGHNGGATLRKILSTLRGIGYTVEYKVLNALDFGLPQKRERVFIVGFRGRGHYIWPTGNLVRMSLENILEENVPEKYYASDRIAAKRKRVHKSKYYPSIWHENKSGNISSYPYSCALRAGASYNYLLVNGERRLTPREMLRLQGFPDKYKIICNDSQTRKQAGNSLPIPVARAVILSLLPILQKNDKATILSKQLSSSSKSILEQVY